MRAMGGGPRAIAKSAPVTLAASIAMNGVKADVTTAGTVGGITVSAVAASAAPAPCARRLRPAASLAHAVTIGPARA
jgi:hypothetical protein